MARKILIASGKGGTGKTCISASLAESLSQKGDKVLIIEGQTGLRSLDLALGAEGESLSHFGNVLKERETLVEAAWKKNDNLYYLASPQTAGPGTYGASDFKKLLALGENLFDFIIVDGPSGVGEDVKASSGGCEEIILVITPEDADIRAAGTCLQTLHRIPPLKSYLVVNRVRDMEMDELLDITELFPSEPLAFIAEDEIVTEKMADRLRGEEIPLASPVRRGLKSRFKSFFGNSK